MDRIAQDSNVWGSTQIEEYVKERTGGGPTASHWSQIFYGDKWASWEVIDRFREAFGLAEGTEEYDELARAYLEEARLHRQRRRRGGS